MQGIVLASHGPLAEAMLETSKLFFGEQEQFKALGLYENDSTEDFASRLGQAISDVDTGEGAIVSLDLLFGSPCNIMIGHLDRENLSIITGLNLPLVTQMLDAREMGRVDLEELISVGQAGICDLRKTLEERMA